MPIDENKRLLGTVISHLDQLTGISAQDVSEAALRVSSASLRALLVEKMLHQAWRICKIGGPITIPTWHFTSKPGPNVMGYCGGADILPGVPLSMCFNATIAETTLNLHDFCKQARIMVETVTVSTVELIQYIANTMGGAHWDPGSKRKAAFRALRALEESDGSHLPVEVNNRNLLHHELLSVIQSVLRSPEVVRLQSLSIPNSLAANAETTRQEHQRRGGS